MEKGDTIRDRIAHLEGEVSVIKGIAAMDFLATISLILTLILMLS